LPRGRSMTLAKSIKDTTKATPCSRDATMSDDLDFVFPIPGHLAMWLDTGFIEFVSLI
jgi:hypothetical protein